METQGVSRLTPPSAFCMLHCFLHVTKPSWCSWLFCILSTLHSTTLAWKIPWTEESVGCSPWGRKELDTTELLQFHFSLSCTGEGNGNPLQCFCVENPRDGGAQWAAIYEVAQNWTRLKRPSSSTLFLYISPGFMRRIHPLTCLSESIMTSFSEHSSTFFQKFYRSWGDEFTSQKADGGVSLDTPQVSFLPPYQYGYSLWFYTQNICILVPKVRC